MLKQIHVKLYLPERPHWHGNIRKHWHFSGVFIVNFEMISHLFVVIFEFSSFKEGEVNLKYLPQRRGGSQKLKKGGESMVQEQVFLKGVEGGGGGWYFSYLIFSRFIIFIFGNYFTFAKLCYAFEENFFFCHQNFIKKNHSKLSKNEPENIS